MWHFRTWFSRHGGGGVTVGLDDLQGLFQTMILWKQIWKAKEFQTLLENAKYCYCIAVMIGIMDEHRPGWQSCAAGLESIFPGSRSPSTAKPLPGLAAVPQLPHHNQTAQAASEGRVYLLQEGREAQAIALDAGILNKQLYFSCIRVQEGEQQIRNGSVPIQPLRCLSTNVR